MSGHTQHLTIAREFDGRTYVVVEYELEDGLPGERTEIAAVWDITQPAGSTGYYSLASLFPDKSEATWYVLGVDDKALVKGGTLSTTPLDWNWPVPTVEHQATVYVSKPVRSPTVEPLALWPIPAAAGRQGQLKIAATQWNGMPLAEVRVDGTLIGWGKDLILTHAGDGVYTYTGSGTGADLAVHAGIPVVATGTDGLKTYTTFSVEVVEDIVIASTAKYPLLTGSADHAVFAVEAVVFVPITSIDVEFPPEFGITGTVTLLDDGNGAEDDVQGDGVFTSAPMTSSAAVGFHTATVTVHPVTGDPIVSVVNVEVVASSAVFEDISGSNGALAIKTGSTGQPFSSIVFETGKNGNPSQHAMVVTFDDATSHPLLLNRTNEQGFDPQFARSEGQWLGAGALLPESSRGTTSGDYNNDNNIDLLLCGANSSKLYRNYGVGQNPQFAAVTDEVFGAEVSLLNGALVASWGDYEGDGDEDLYVTTSDYSGPVGEIGAQSGVNYEFWMFQNDGLGHLKKRFGAGAAEGDACMSGSWAPLKGSTAQMLVSPWIADGYKLVVHDPGQTIYDYTLTPYPWLIFEDGVHANLEAPNSITPFSYDGDALIDLLVTDAGGDGRAVILRNNWHWDISDTLSYWAREFELIPLDDGRHWNGATIADFDGNSLPDILLLPESGQPALFMASGTQSAPVYRDLAFPLGLRSGETSGAVAADFGGNNLADLYMGRTGAGEFLYKNVGAAAQNWLDIDLSTVGNSCSSLVGTEVVVSRGGTQWRQWIDGGGGRGGQNPNSMRFYLGEGSGDVSVTVNYPSGDSDSDSAVPVGSTYTTVEDTPITLKVGTKNDPDPTFVTELGPETMDWVFRWRTVGIKGDQRQDAVTIENHIGYTSGDGCYIGIDQGAPRVLRLGDPGVTVRIYQDGADWRHELRWSGLPCVTDCQYRFTVTSGIGNDVTSTSTVRVMPPVSFCLPQP